MSLYWGTPAGDVVGSVALYAFPQLSDACNSRAVRSRMGLVYMVNNWSKGRKGAVQPSTAQSPIVPSFGSITAKHNQQRRASDESSRLRSQHPGEL